MELKTQERKNVDYFTGVEIENTIMKGEPTLFVVGVRPFNHIVSYTKKTDIKHVYLGTSQSFTPETALDWDSWDELIDKLLTHDFWVTLDFDVKYVGIINEYNWCESMKFIPMISVKIPYLNLFNYNTTLKIDDNTWGYSNPGVWCHPLNELTTRDVFTSWKDYKTDTKVDIE